MPGLVFESAYSRLHPIRFMRAMVLAAVKERLMRRARNAVQIFGSAFEYQPVIVPLMSPLERWAARQMHEEGAAIVSGDTVELGVYTLPLSLHGMSLRRS